jgi:PAS domain S-box-containing protein
LKFEATRHEEGRYLGREWRPFSIFKRPRFKKMGIDNSEIAIELLENSPDAMMALSPEGAVVYWNKGAEHTFGYSRTEAIGKKLSELIIAADPLAEEAGSLKEVMDHGYSNFEAFRKRKDGSLIQVDISTRSILDDQGHVKYLLSSKRDITQRKQLEESRHASEFRYRRLFETAKDGILILDADSGKIVDVNPFLIEMLGFSKEYLSGKELWEIGIFKDIVASKLAFEELSERGYIRYDDLPLQSSSGAIRQVEFVSNSYMVGETRVIQCNIRDITDRKLAEEARRATEARYRTLFEYAPAGIVIADQNSYYLDANVSMCRMLGYTRDELIGMHASDIVADSEFQHIGSALSTLNGKHDHNREWQFRRKDTSVFAAEVIATMMPDGNLLGLVHDITDRKQAEEELRQSNESLAGTLAELQTKTKELGSMTQQFWQASKLATMGELAASVAHELNNPLATISLRAETVVSQLSEDDPNCRSLLIIEQEVERMASLVSNLLLFSRRSQKQISTLNLQDELTNTLDFIEYHLRSNQIDIVHDFAPDVPTVQADRQLLRQVFLNLITNAGDAMPKGGTLTVRTRPGFLADGRSGAVIELSDTGTGVQTSDLPKLWEPFFTTKPEGKGTGLGLSICRRTVEEHRGTIEIETGPGKGTTVRITLPGTDPGIKVEE